MRMDLSSPSACYPEDGPSPISSVTLEVLPGTPQTQIDWLFKILSEYSWTKVRIRVEKVEQLH